MTPLQQLIEERDKLTARLNWLGIHSDGSEKLERRIKEIDAEIERNRKAS